MACALAISVNSQSVNSVFCNNIEALSKTRTVYVEWAEYALLTDDPRSDIPGFAETKDSYYQGNPVCDGPMIKGNFTGSVCTHIINVYWVDE